MKGEIKELDSTGDSRVAGWDTADAESVTQAREVFERFRRRGFMQFAAPEGGEARLLREFDPEAETIIASPRISGG